MARTRDHDWGFSAYAVNGFLIAFGFVFWPILVIALPLLAVVCRRYRWPDDLGLMFGFALVVLLVGTSGVDHAEIWLGIGTTLAATSALAFWQLRCRPTS